MLNHGLILKETMILIDGRMKSNSFKILYLFLIKFILTKKVKEFNRELTKKNQNLKNFNVNKEIFFMNITVFDQNQDLQQQKLLKIVFL